jgi:CBS domain-containing protein
MLTQRDVVDFLYQWASDRRLPMLLQTLEELRLVTTLKGSPLVTVPETFTALDAMQKMYHSKVNAVAVVDGEGRLLANLSNTDVRYLTQDRLSSIFLPVCLFLSEVQGKKPAKPIAVHVSSTLGEVMLKVITARVKGVWLVDSNCVPVGVVTLTDIISEFASREGTLRPAEQSLRR